MYIIATVAEGATEGVGGYMATLKWFCSIPMES